MLVGVSLRLAQNVIKTRTLAHSGLLAETVGFEPTDGFTRQTISSRSRYDHFDTSPNGKSKIVRKLHRRQNNLLSVTFIIYMIVPQKSTFFSQLNNYSKNMV